MRRFWWLALAAFLLVRPSSAQSSITVVLRHADTGEPISSASLRLDPANRTAGSDRNGIARFEAIPAGDYILTATKEGFEPERRALHVTTTPMTFTVHLRVKTYRILPMEINAQRAVERFSPVTFSEYIPARIREEHVVQDFPEMLSNLPSTMYYSENGNGIGYNYLRIRGFDQRRLAVMVNGVPQNDPEDHNVYWLDFADLLGSTENIQVQRGAGSAFYGPPAIGGSINIITGDFGLQRAVTLSSGAGSYNTQRHAVSFGSGLIDNTYACFARFSKTVSDGYRDKSWTNFNSYYASISRYDPSMTTRINLYGGPISDGLAYTGLPRFTIANRDLRRANYNYWEASDSAYTYTQNRRPQETEEFSQPHYELLHEWRVNDRTTLHNTFFYVTGRGYFDYDGTGYTDTSYYRMTSHYGFSGVPNPANPLIRAYVDNRQFGWLPRLTVRHEDGTLTAGFEFRRHRSLHWGRIQWAENLPVNLDPDRHYYEYRGGKNVLSAYLQEAYSLSSRLNVMATLQYTFNRYMLFDERFVGTDFTIDYHFINPRLGLNYNIDENLNVYTNLSYTSREPRLKNLYDAAESSGGATPQFEQRGDGTYDFSKPLVKPERLFNIELGAGYKVEDASLLLNGYYMNFEDEIVKSGRLDRFGQPVTGNARRTRHVGVEAVLSYRPNQQLELEWNGMYSNSTLQDYTVYKQDPASGTPTAVSLAGNPIAGFPDLILNVRATFRAEGFTASVSLRHVGPQYTDNERNEKNKTDAYTVLNGWIGYRLSEIPGFRSLEVRIVGNNLLDRLYAMSGEGDQFFVAAERNFFFNLSLEL